jgi:flavin-dependent dehydrogenase
MTGIPLPNQTDLKLGEGSRVAVMGGGPAGSFFSYFLLDMAERLGRQIQVDIYEPRDFNMPGPAGCNMCAGVVSETLVQYLAAEGINLPPTVVERGIDSYVLHMDVGNVRIDAVRHEKRIGTLYRGIGPRGLKEIKWESFDNHLLMLAIGKGACVIRQRVTEVHRQDGRLTIKAQNGPLEAYDLLAVTAGVNTAALKLFEGLGFGYQPPRTTKCFVREYYLGEEVVERYMGSSFHAFLLNIPRLEFAAIVPKGDYVSLALLGQDIDRDMVQSFVNDPAVKGCLPPDFPSDQAACWCAPRINVRGSPQPFGDRIVFIGDCGVSRLYKDGVGAAYRAAKAAARTAMFQGISAVDFRRHYWPVCRAMETDNLIGKVIFTIVRQIQKRQFARRAVLRMVSSEQEGKADPARGMSLVMWDVFTGSAPYREVFLRTLHPAFWTHLLCELVISLWPVPGDGTRANLQSSGSPKPVPGAGADIHKLSP